MFASGKTAAVASAANYIEDVFSTYLYTGNGSTQTITNGIDLSTKGGLTWIKRRDAAVNNRLFDTARGATYALYSNLTNAQATEGSSLTSFDSSGFSLSSDSGVNLNNGTYASWTFRKQPKFFDVVTYTGTGIVRTVSHNLGSTPGCIIVKAYSGTNAGIENWTVYHRSLGGTKALRLNTTGAEIVADSFWNDTDPTSTVFTVADNGAVNGNGLSYVAYLFAHNAGGFGLTGTDNVISCGSFTTDGSGNATVTLGYEPQWVVIKNTTSPENWFLNDIMRGMPAPPSGSGTNVNLFPNTSAAESIQGYDTSPTATGFAARTGNPSQTYIYIAIRRGPMKVPTSGTSVFAPITGTTDANFGFPADFVIFKNRAGTSGQPFFTRLLDYKYLNSSNTFAEGGSSGDAVWNASQTTFSQALTGASSIFEGFRRAPSFFDVVCYTGNSTAGRQVTHNLGVAPELVIVKLRNAAGESWIVWNKTIYAINAASFLYLNFNSTRQVGAAYFNGNTSSTAFTVGTDISTNQTGKTYVAYLFATCAGVSKVGSYTGTGTTLQVDCGFTGGARFVLIKRTDSTGDWYVWDSARGIVSGNDPYLLLNSTDAEVTNTDYVDTYSAGFEISSTAPAAINASGGTFIFLAIA